MMASLPYVVKGERVKISTEYDDSKYCFEVSSNIKNTKKNVADRILLDIRKRYPLMTNHGGHVYYGISPEDRTVCGEILNNVEKKKIRETIANDINFKINSLHRNIDVYFTPVRNDEGRIISNLFVIGIRVFPLEKVGRRGYKRSSGYFSSLVTPPVQSQTISFTHKGKIKKKLLNQVELVKHGKFKVPTKKYWQETVKYEILKDDKSSHNHDSSVAHRITLKHNKLLDYVCDFANHHGGELYYGVNSKGIVCGEAILETEIKEVYEKVKKKIASMVWPEHVHDHKFWAITFLPVKDKNIHQRLYVIQISVKPCRGGVLNARIQENEKTFDRNFLPNDYQTFVKRLEWVESFTIVDTNEECNAGHLEIVCKLGEVPRTAEIVKLFGEEILPFITYKMCSKRDWFETNIFDENYTMKKEYKNKLTSFSWVKDFYIGVAIVPEKSWQIYITYAQNNAPSMTDLKKLFGVNIASFVDFIQDGEDDKEPLPPPRYLRGPRSGDKLCARPESNGDGTIGILSFDGKHYAITCYHSCFNADVPESIRESIPEIHKLLKNDCENENSVGCQGAIRVYTTTNPNLGQFQHGLYDDDHDIAIIALEPSIDCAEAVRFYKKENIMPELADRKEVADMLYTSETGKLPVQKFGAITGITEGELFAVDSLDSQRHNSTMEFGYKIKGIHGQTFAMEGDSGSLLYLLNGRKPFGYLCSEIPQRDNSAVYGCRNLNHSIKELISRKKLSDIQPCFNNH